MRRYNPLPTALVPLGNSGVTPPAVNLTAVDIDAKLSFYGQYIQINEQVTLQNQDPVLNEAAARLGVSLRQTEDTLTRDMLAGTASFVNCTGGVNGDVPTEITRSDVDTIVRALLNANAYTILDNIEGEDKFGTAPVRDAYFALCSTQLTGNLDAVNGFIQKNQYPAPMNALRSEWGAVGNLRFLVSSIGSFTPNASSLGQDVYNIFCCGLEAYACVQQDGYSASFIYRPPIYDGPLALNASVGYKFAEVPRITNDQWIINLRATLAV
jgi:N4-gp56 family major capsid protein